MWAMEREKEAADAIGVVRVTACWVYSRGAARDASCLSAVGNMVRSLKLVFKRKRRVERQAGSKCHMAIGCGVFRGWNPETGPR